uniref:Uncharacterized protein n=1 Tax=Oryza nivara TaxID=4536 RepID=A0A0E0JCK6_ORYNI
MDWAAGRRRVVVVPLLLRISSASPCAGLRAPVASSPGTTTRESAATYGYQGDADDVGRGNDAARTNPTTTTTPASSTNATPTASHVAAGTNAPPPTTSHAGDDAAAGPHVSSSLLRLRPAATATDTAPASVGAARVHDSSASQRHCSRRAGDCSGSGRQILTLETPGSLSLEEDIEKPDYQHVPEFPPPWFLSSVAKKNGRQQPMVTEVIHVVGTDKKLSQAIVTPPSSRRPPLSAL